MFEYVYDGPKTKAVKIYQKINFVEKQMKSVSHDEIYAYNYSLGLIYKWMQLAIETRKKNIIHRLSLSRVKREVRAQKEDEARQRAEDRESALTEANGRWEIENRDDIDKFNTYEEKKALGELEDEANPIDFSGDGIPQISPGLISDAMIDINKDDPLYRYKPR